MNKLTEWLTNPFIKEDINIPVDIGDTILVGKFKNKKMKIKDIGKDKHGMPTINGRKAATFRIHKTVNIFDEDNIDESKTEFVIWGIPPGKRQEDILYTKAKSHSEAKKIIKILTSKHGVTKARIQVLDMAQDPKDIWKSDDLFEGVNDPGIFKAVFLAGGPGSGKSYVAGGLFGIPDRLTTSAHGLKLVNQDTELENFLKKYFGTTDLDNMSDDLFRQITDPGYSAHMGVRKHAKALSKQRLKLYSQGRLGVIIDGTGHKFSDVKKERQKLIDLGYDTYMVFVNTSLEVAQMRNKLRDRVLPSELVEKYWNNVQKNMAFFQGMFGGSNFMLVDNNATLKPKQAQKKFNMLVKKGIGNFVRKPIKNRLAKKWVDKQKLLKKYEIKELFPSVDGTIPSPSRKRVKKNKTDSMSGYDEIDECIAVAKKFGDDIVIGKNRDRNYNPNLKVVRELTGYGVELCYIVDQDTDWSEGMNSEGIGIVNSALFVKRDEKDFDKAKKKKAMSKDGVRIREALQHKTLKKVVKSLITYQDGIKGHTIISDGKKVVIIENTSRVEPSVTIHDIESSPVVRANHGVQHPEQGYQRGPDKLSSQLRAKNALNILSKEEDYKKFFPAFYNHTQDKGSKFDLVRAQNKLWTSSQLMMNLNKKEVTLYLIPGAVKFLGIENTLPNDYESKIKLKVRQYEHGPSDKYDTYVTTDKKKKKSAIKDKDTAVVPENKKIKKLQKVLDLYGKSVVYSISEDEESAFELTEQKEIKKVVGIYGGRFQPFGPHHKKTYEWMKSKFDDVYITTSNIKQPPRHPMNFNEKVRHMTKMGIPSSKIIKERSPYVAKNTLNKFDGKTTAVVYIFGAKDVGRLKGGKYFQDYKKNKNKMNGYEENGYVLTAPHVSMTAAGMEVSGTTMRKLLGSPEYADDRERRFKKYFGYFDKGVYTMMTNKFKKLFESIEEFLINNDISELIKENSTSAAFQADDGPPIHYRGFEDYKKFSKKWIDEMAVKYGWEVVDYILGKKAHDPALDYTLAYNIVPAVAYGKKQTGDYGSRFGVEDPVGEYKKHLGRIVAKNIGYEIIKWFGITPVGDGYTGVAVEAPILPGISKDNTTNTKIASKKGEKTNRGKSKLNTLKERINKEENSVIKTKPYSKEQAEEEVGEYFENVAAYEAMPELAKDKDDLTQKILDASEEVLSDGDLRNMINTDAGDVLDSDNPMKHAHKKAIEYKKSWNYIKGEIKKGNPQEAPIAIRDKNGKMWLLAGNTRLMAQTAHGNKIPVKVIKYDGNIKVPQKEIQNKLDLTEYVNLLVSDKPYKGKELLLMGGAYGHMNHPFDDKNITFSDLKNIIILGLGGKLNREDGVTEKLDGQNLMVSWVNGKLVTARNKGQLKNFGSSAMDISGVASKFAGRGDIKNAFVYAMRDLGKSIGSLSVTQKEKVFGNGKRWMNLEVIYPASANVIDYDKAQIVFHGTLEYNESGTSIGQPTDSARMLAGMITQVNQHVQKHYAIAKPQFLTVPKVQDFGKKKSTYLNKLRKLQNQYRLKDGDTISKYHQSFWEEFIFNATKQHKAKIPNKVLVNLTKRWAFFDKSYSIPQIKKDLKKFPDLLDWVLSFDKNDHQKWVKDNMKPFEVLFFQVGAEILKNISGYLAVSPDKAVQRIRKDVINAIRTIQSGGDVTKIQTLKHQLEKLEAIGGLSSIVPTEGIVFKYKGKTYKFTGAFAPVNQILGLLNF